jgi:hypothetical protein
MKRDGLDSSLGVSLGSATFCGGRGRCVPSSAGECFAQDRPSAAATAEVEIDFPERAPGREQLCESVLFWGRLPTTLRVYAAGGSRK